MSRTDEPKRGAHTSPPAADAGRARAPLQVVVNASAGRAGARAVERIRAALADAGVAAEVEPGRRQIEDALRAAVEGGAHMVGIAGGDGSARTAAQLLIGSETALAVFPTGTLNNFSRALGIETVEEAAHAVASGRILPVGAGTVNDVVFLNTATFGLYADVLRRRERLRRWLGKWPAALVGFLVTIARYRPVRIMLDVEGRRMELETALVRVAIGRASFPVASASPRERRTPELEIAILRAHTRAGLLALGFRTALRILRTVHSASDPDVEILHTRAFSLASHRERIGITLDGEITHIRGALDVRVRDAALRVVVATEKAR